jgi:hypothetical protein
MSGAHQKAWRIGRVDGCAYSVPVECDAGAMTAQFKTEIEAWDYLVAERSDAIDSTRVESSRITVSAKRR